MISLAERFEAKVDRSGEHHLWTGAKKKDGTGLMKVGGKLVTARRVAWDLAHGPLPSGADVVACGQDKSCVRLDHLSLRGLSAPEQPPGRQRSRDGRGTKTEIRPGVWKFTVSAGRYRDGSRRRLHRTVQADTDEVAERQLVAFAAEIYDQPQLERREDRDLTVHELVARYLAHLRDDKGRSERTVRGYQQVHDQWGAPQIGHRRVRDVEESDIDKLFGQMRRAGLSRSRMNEARSLYQPLFKWARRQRLVTGRGPMGDDYELPTSKGVARTRSAPEVDQLSLLLNAAVEYVPDVAPVLTLGAVTGMRRGELVVVRRSRLRPGRRELLVDEADDVDGVKPTKTNTERIVSLDDETLAMLVRHCQEMDQRAAACGATIADDAFIFSREPDCSTPMPADYVTKRVAVLKEHLGIEDKRPDTVALEDEALRLHRQPWTRPPGRRGPTPKGGMPYAEIGRRLGRSSRWAALAVAAAERREATRARGQVDHFDGSILALRKFTSTELLDAGFNIKAVAARQGHSPEVLVKHYAQGRRAANRRAAEHLGRLVHGGEVAPGPSEDGPSL